MTSCKNKRYNLFICIIFLILVACAPLIGPYSPTAYQNATSLKAETLAVMDRATLPYPDNELSIQELMVKIDAAYEYVNGIPSNSISAQQWMLLKKPDGNLLGKFFHRWKEKGVLSQEYITEFKGLVSDAFDEIICLEANKKNADDCKK
ncbi:MAG TPA: hypothetical protein PKH14_04475 [Syntrophorhabdus sp.]|nr:hypothetical protein [Syntrophorhabdus sp.]